MAGAVEVRFDTPERLWDAVQLARVALRRAGRLKGYYRNSMDSHLVGSLGQVAVEQWAQGSGIHVESIFRDPKRVAESDVLVRCRSNLRVEVKTWTRDFWPDLGRCVAVGQMADLKKKADVIVWAVLDDTGTIPVVLVRGWSTPSEVAATPPRETGRDGMAKINNHQVEDAALHELAEMATL